MDTHSLAHTLECHVAMTKREAAPLAITWMHLKHDAQCDSIYVKHPQQAHPEIIRGLVVAKSCEGGWGVTADGDRLLFGVMECSQVPPPVPPS